VGVHSKSGHSNIKLTFDEIRGIEGFQIDHSFLNYKKELTKYRYRVEAISLKEKAVMFSRIDEA